MKRTSRAGPPLGPGGGPDLFDSVTGAVSEDCERQAVCPSGTAHASRMTIAGQGDKPYSQHRLALDKLPGPHADSIGIALVEAAGAGDGGLLGMLAGLFVVVRAFEVHAG